MRKSCIYDVVRANARMLQRRVALLFVFLRESSTEESLIWKGYEKFRKEILLRLRKAYGESE